MRLCMIRSGWVPCQLGRITKFPTRSGFSRMKQRIVSSLFGAIAAVTAASAVGAPGLASAQTVNIYNWNDYIGQTTLEDFKAETAIPHHHDTHAHPDILKNN